MGADFILVGVPAAKIDDARKLTLLQIVSELSEDSLDDSGGFEDLAEYRTALEQAVEFLGRAQNSREIAIFRLPGALYKVLLTGGMSWGDAPTDAFEHLERINRCEALVEQLEEWAIEDFRAGCDKSE